MGINSLHPQFWPHQLSPPFCQYKADSLWGSSDGLSLGLPEAPWELRSHRLLPHNSEGPKVKPQPTPDPCTTSIQLCL
jgi:hypothetical protein